MVTLKVQGFIIGVIRSVEAPAVNGHIPRTWFSPSISPNSTRGETNPALLRALTGDRAGGGQGAATWLRDNQNAPRSYLRAFEHILSRNSTSDHVHMRPIDDDNEPQLLNQIRERVEAST